MASELLVTSGGSPRALVTGGAGFIGSHLVERLLADGWQVRVLDDFSSGREANLAPAAGRVELIRADVRDEDAVERAVRGVDAVFHLAAIPSVVRSVEEPLVTDAVNIHGTLGLLEASRRAGVGRLVFAASCAAYGSAGQVPSREDQAPAPISPYALQKLAGEHYCRLYGELFDFPAVALRFFNVYGPRQNPDADYAAAIPLFIRACLRGEAPRIYGDGAQTRDFVFVGDVVNACMLAAASQAASGRVINVGSGVETSVMRLAEETRDLAGRASGQPVHAPARPGEVLRSVADLDRARRLMGYEPQVALAEGLRRTIESFRDGEDGGMAA